MREIKFRAWDDVNKVMVYGININGGKPVKPGFQWFNTENGILHSEPQQYTGLKDCNGKEIYEGDLLQHTNGTIAEIQYSDDLASFVAVYTQNGNTEMDYLDKEIVSECKIVGNIYENPELLEVKESE